LVAGSLAYKTVIFVVFPASKSAAYDLAPECVLDLCKTILEHLDAILGLCDFVHDLVHSENWLPVLRAQLTGGLSFTRG